jgi:protein O-mannosyl-transferase
MMRIPETVRKYLPFCLLAAAVFLVYGNTFRNPFIWDDAQLIIYNPFIKNLMNFPHYFTNDLMRGGSSNFYRPFQTIIYALVYHLYGLKTWPYHLVNILLHTGAAALFFILLRQLYAPGIALAASLLFAVHPLNTEAVTYIAGTADPLFMCLSLGMILAFSRGRYLAGVLLLIPALLSKESALLFPVLCLLFLWARDGVIPKKTACWLLGLFAVMAVYAGLRLTVLSFPAHITPVPFAERFLSAFKSLLIYLLLLVFPNRLSMDRSFPYLTTPLDPWFLCGFLVFVLTVALLVRYRRRRLLVFPGIWVLCTVLPVSSLIATLNANISEHWMYPGCIGFFLYLVLLLQRIGRRTIVLAAVALIAAGCTARSIVRNTDWNNEEKFYTRSIACFPDSPRMHYNLGVLYKQRGEYEKALAELRQAEQLRTAVAPQKDTLISLMLAETLVKLGRVSEAGNYYNLVLARMPTHPVALHDMARIALKDGDVNTAVGLLQECMRANPAYQPAYYELGRICLERGSPANAKKLLTVAVQMFPEDSLAHNLLGVMYRQAGDTASALREFELAHRYNPGEPSFMLNLAFLLRSVGQTDQAIAWYQQARAAAPDDPAIANELAVTCAMTGDVAHAVTLWEAIVKQHPDYAPARQNLARALSGGHGR